MFRLPLLYFSICLLSSTVAVSSWPRFERTFTNLIRNIISIPEKVVEFLKDATRYDYEELEETNVEKEYDFIIVGAGSSGAAVASRLSEIPDVSVLLIEAGERESKFYDIPIYAMFLQGLGINWNFRTEPSNDYCRGILENSCRWPRGKVMGGTSVINCMIATRGNPQDYNQWAEMGNPGWSYKDVLPYFKKMERNLATQTPNYDFSVRGDNGPVTISHRYTSRVARAFIQAGKEIGYEEIDYNGRRQIGFAEMQANIDTKGLRVSSNVAYLHPVRHRNNLHVIMGSMVEKVNINPVNGNTESVNIIKSGEKFTVGVRKEVILSAGALQSPQILMLSGIGPLNHLSELGIDVIKNVPGVGQNLMDHVTYFGHIFLINSTDTILARDSLDPFNTVASDYLESGGGKLGTASAVEAIAFVNTENISNPMSNVEFLYVDLSFALDTPNYTLDLMGLRPEIYRSMYEKYRDARAFQIMPVLLKPKSTGEIRLISKNIHDYPKFIANYYKDPDDLRVMIKALRMALVLSSTEALKKFGSQLVPELVYGCEHFPFNSDKYWECALRVLTYTFWHFSGTTKMGPISDRMAVVDERLRVRGVNGLRVIDCSIMPVVVSGHTNVPAMMIGEKGADLIKEDWGYKQNQESRESLWGPPDIWQNSIPLYNPIYLPRTSITSYNTNYSASP